MTKAERIEHGQLTQEKRALERRARALQECVGDMVDAACELSRCQEFGEPYSAETIADLIAGYRQYRELA